MGRPEVAAAYEQTRLRYELARPACCCGNCLPAGAGLLTWWRRPAPRASARQGAAGRPPRSRRAARSLVRLLASFACQLARFPNALGLPRPNSAMAGRPSAPKACP
jgi:hypothetical protein